LTKNHLIGSKFFNFNHKHATHYKEEGKTHFKSASSCCIQINQFLNIWQSGADKKKSSIEKKKNHDHRQKHFDKKLIDFLHTQIRTNQMVFGQYLVLYGLLIFVSLQYVAFMQKKNKIGSVWKPFIHLLSTYHSWNHCLTNFIT
jgi:hypothetical protein